MIHSLTLSPMPSPLAVASILPASIMARVSASRPRHAANMNYAYLSGAISVACVIASASSISDEAAPKAPACT